MLLICCCQLGLLLLQLLLQGYLLLPFYTQAFTHFLRRCKTTCLVLAHAWNMPNV